MHTPLNAIILCAGMGSRLQPFTNIAPKPLLTIGGQTLIERTIVFLRESGVENITLVTGYKREQFAPLIDKYHLNECFNQAYETRNNHQSILCAQKTFANSLIVEGDLFLEKNIFAEIIPSIQDHPEQSLMIVQPTREGQTEWEILTDENQRLSGVKKDSPAGCSMSGISYWSANDAATLISELKQCAPNDYWEDALLRRLKDIDLKVLSKPRFQTEIDSLSDALEQNLLTPEDIAFLCSNGRPPEKLKGMTNNTYLIHQNGQAFVLRVANPHMNCLINRDYEEKIMAAIADKGIAVPAKFMTGGMKVTPYRDNAHVLCKDPVSYSEVRAVMKLLKRLHSLPFDPKTCPRISLKEEILRYEIVANTIVLSEAEHHRLMGWAEAFDAEPSVICHRDLVPENILVTDGKPELIDFEYAACMSRYWDIASFFSEMPLSRRDEDNLIALYGDLDPQKVRQMKAIVAYIWALWGFHQKVLPYARERLRQYDDFIAQLAQ